MHCHEDPLSPWHPLGASAWPPCKSSCLSLALFSPSLLHLSLALFNPPLLQIHVLQLQGCAFVLARPSDAGGAWLPVELSLDAFVTANKLLSVLAPDRMQLFQSHRLEVPPQESIEI